MRIDVIPQKIIPARFEVVFFEDRQHTPLLAYPEPYATKLRADLEAWLDARDPGWSVSFDRGDWGEGPASVTISFTQESAAREFHDRWNTGLCTDESSECCSNMAEISETERRCDVCGEHVRIWAP